MTNNRHTWTEEEKDLLRKVYPTNIHPKELRAYFPGISARRIADRARRLGLSRLKHSYCGSDLSKLVEETPEAYYWAGFIAADGWVSRQGQIIIALAELDKDHLQKVADFFKTKIHPHFKPKDSGLSKKDLIHYRITAASQIYGIEFIKKFDSKVKKTYNPPKIKIFKGWSDDLFLSYLAGFIDGDGSIYLSNNKKKNKKYVNIKFANHASWIDVLRYFRKRLEKCLNTKFSNPRIEKNGTARFVIYQPKAIKLLKDKLLKLNLPLMSRKWDKVELSD